MANIKLNTPPVKLRVRREGDNNLSVWDIVRGIFVAMTPEERVRQHLIHMLIDDLNIPKAQIVVEYSVNINGQPQRADIVVLNRDGSAKILVECKAPDIKISQATLDQAVRYNAILKAKFIILSNGLTHHIYRRDNDEGAYSPIDSFELIL